MHMHGLYCAISLGPPSEPLPALPGWVAAHEQLSTPGGWVGRRTLDKFPADRCLTELSDSYLALDGVVLNSRQLCIQEHAAGTAELVEALYARLGERFPDSLRGSFSGMRVEKRTGRVCLFVDHIGSKPLYYHYDAARRLLLAASEVKAVAALMRHFGIPVRLDEQGAYSLLTFGFMLHDWTLVRDVKRVLPGTVLTCDSEGIASHPYHLFTNSNMRSERKADYIEGLDARFRAAVRLEYDKDVEAGYRHIGTLSGGLDSRMNMLVAAQEGFSELTAITFSQSNYLDFSIAQTIARDHHFEFLYKMLDHGDYLADVDTPCEVNDGLVLYSGAAHLLSTLRLLNWEDFGLLHTGMIGDGVMGGFLHDPLVHIKSDPFIGTHSKTLTNRLTAAARAVWDTFDNEEIYLLYQRGFNGALNGYVNINRFTDPISPFLDPDFIDYALTIPPQYRYKERLYQEWIVARVPDAARYRWERTGVRVNAGKAEIFTRRVLAFLARKVGIAKFYPSMNPFDYWYQTNPRLMTEHRAFIERNLPYLDGSPEIRADVRALLDGSSTIDRHLAMTLLSAARNYLAPDAKG